MRTPPTHPDLCCTNLRALCCIILPLIPLGFLSFPLPPTSHPSMDILGPHSTTHDYIYTPDPYVALSCNLTLERIRHNLLTRVGSFVDTCFPALFFSLTWYVCNVML
jgi:hypothetical protein